MMTLRTQKASVNEQRYNNETAVIQTEQTRIPEDEYKLKTVLETECLQLHYFIEIISTISNITATTQTQLKTTRSHAFYTIWQQLPNKVKKN